MMSSRHAWERRGPFLEGLLVLAVAVDFRLHRLSVSHVGIAEYLGITQPPGTPMIDYLMCAHEVNPDHVPFYFAFVYFVREVFGHSWVTGRVASMVLGVLTVFLVWRFAKLHFGRAVGLLAGLMVALSPADVYHATQPRPYVLEIFLAVISLIALVNAMTRGGRGWWILNVTANTLMAWTHLFGVLFIATEAVWLFWRWCGTPDEHAFFRRAQHAIRRLLPWCAGHVLVFALAITWWVRATDSQVSWFATPPPLQILADLFGDAFLHHNLFTYENDPKSGPFDFSPLAIRGPIDFWVSSATDLLLAAAMIVALVSVAQQLRGVRCLRDEKRRSIAMLLLLIAFLPPLVLHAMAQVWFPMALPRYTSYSNFAYYTALAIGAAGLNKRWARIALSLVLCSGLAVECKYWSRALITNDWKGIVRCLDWRGNPPSRVICLNLETQGCTASLIVKRMLRRSDRAHPSRYLAAYTIDGAVDACVATQTQQGNDLPVYLLTYERQPQPEHVQRLVEKLKAAGFRRNSEMRHRFTVHVLSSSKLSETWKGPLNDTAQRFRDRLEQFLPGDVDAAEVNAALRWAVSEGDDLDDLDFLEAAPTAMLEISPKAALAAAHLIPPTDTSASASLARILCALANGSDEDLSPLLEQFTDEHRLAFARPLLAALAKHDWPGARDLVEHLRSTDGVLLPPVVIQMVGIEQRLPWAAPLQLPPAAPATNAGVAFDTPAAASLTGEGKGEFGTTATP